MRNRPDVVVACPGRLLDLLQQGVVRLDRIETLVLDEADHMFDMGFLPDLKRILKALPERRQNLFYSATHAGPGPQARQPGPERPRRRRARAHRARPRRSTTP